MRDSPPAFAEAKTAPPKAPSEPAAPRRRLSLKLLTPLATALCGLALCALVASILLRNARTAVEEELHSAFETTRANVILRMPPPFSARDTLGDAILLAEEIDARRHVSAVVADPSGKILSRRAESGEGQEVPGWFLRLLTPQTEEDLFAVTHYPNVLGLLRLSSDPRDEIGEVWEDFRVVLPLLGSTALTLLILTSLFNMFVLSRLQTVVSAVDRMRGGDLKVRAPEGRLTELAALSEGVNALARHLEAEHAENARLQSRLLHLSEAERARIASDLHDEIGPQIFGLQAAARQAQAALKAAPEAPAALAEALEAIGRHASAVQKGARAAIEDLRPMAAGSASLAELIQEQIAEFMAAHPGLEIDLHADPLAATDELREIAIYRFLRESLLNAVRHGGATRIRVELRALRDPPAILARVSDDGSGLKSEPPAPNLGHLGMRDRAQALGALWTPPRRVGSLTVTEMRTPCR